MRELVPIILESELDEFERIFCGCLKFTTRINIDFVDWSRTSNKTIGVDDVLQVLTKLNYSLTIDYDLMLDNPAYTIEQLVRQKFTRYVAINVDAKGDLKDYISLANSVGTRKAGLSLNPENKVEDYAHYFPELKLINILTIIPGSQGNIIMPEVMEKVIEIKNLGFDGIVSIDGGVNINTIDDVVRYPFDSITVGSGIVKQENPMTAYQTLLKFIQKPPSK